MRRQEGPPSSSFSPFKKGHAHWRGVNLICGNAHTNVRLLVNISQKSQKKSTSVGHPLSIKHGKLENSSIAVIGSRHVVTSLVEFSQIWNLMKSPWFKDVQMSRIPWQNSIIFVAFWTICVEHVFFSGRFAPWTIPCWENPATAIGGDLSDSPGVRPRGPMGNPAGTSLEDYFIFGRFWSFKVVSKCLTISGENRLIHSTKMCFLFSGLEFIKGNHGQGINKNVNVLPTWELPHNPIGKLVRNG